MARPRKQPMPKQPDAGQLAEFHGRLTLDYDGDVYSRIGLWVTEEDLPEAVRLVESSAGRVLRMQVYGDTIWEG